MLFTTTDSSYNPSKNFWHITFFIWFINGIMLLAFGNLFKGEKVIVYFLRFNGFYKRLSRICAEKCC